MTLDDRPDTGIAPGSSVRTLAVQTPTQVALRPPARTRDRILQLRAGSGPQHIRGYVGGCVSIGFGTNERVLIGFGRWRGPPKCDHQICRKHGAASRPRLERFRNFEVWRNRFSRRWEPGRTYSVLKPVFTLKTPFFENGLVGTQFAMYNVSMSMAGPSVGVPVRIPSPSKND